MTNHFHLLVEPAEVGDLGRFMQIIGRRYVRYVNESYAGPAVTGRRLLGEARGRPKKWQGCRLKKFSGPIFRPAHPPTRYTE